MNHRKVGVIGNCQREGLTNCIGAMLPLWEVQEASIAAEQDDLQRLDQCDIIFVQNHSYGYENVFAQINLKKDVIVRPWPNFYFPAFHPDMVVDSRAASPMGAYHSAICLGAYLQGLSREEASTLYSEKLFEALGYLDFWEPSKQGALSDIEAAKLPSHELFEAWTLQGVFSYTVNHPTLSTVRLIAEALLRSIAIKPIVQRPDLYMKDTFAELHNWPIPGAIAESLGCRPSETFRIAKDAPITTETFVGKSYACYEAQNRDTLRAVLTRSPEVYADIRRFIRRSKTHEYSGLPRSHFWNSTVGSANSVTSLDPVVQTKFKIAPDDRVATAGSCFAQYISRRLIAAGRDFLQVEDEPEGNAAVYSARYGNLYTARQFLQLFQRATGTLKPRDIAWRRQDGRYIDPFRPQVFPAGFATVEDVVKARSSHLESVRRMLVQTDVMVFTLGLTECWLSAQGIAVPVPPGAAGATASVEYTPHNLSVGETVSDMHEAIRIMRRENPRLRILLTVSPVPLVATFENRHVLAATVCSKSILRAATDELVRAYPFVDYFPSYEMVTSGSFFDESLFEADRRTVASHGVDHVMSVLFKHYFEAPNVLERAPAIVSGPEMSKRSLASRIEAIFDPEWYLFAYEDIRKAGVDPWRHYLSHGAKEHRWPNAVFDPSLYIWQTGNDKKARQNPLAHYLEIGAAKGWSPNRFCHVESFQSRFADYKGVTVLEEFASRHRAFGSITDDTSRRVGSLRHASSRQIAAEIQAKSALLCDEELLAV